MSVERDRKEVTDFCGELIAGIRAGDDEARRRGVKFVRFAAGIESDHLLIGMLLFTQICAGWEGAE